MTQILANAVFSVEKLTAIVGLVTCALLNGDASTRAKKIIYAMNA